MKLEDYRAILREEFESRRRKNVRYSLRAFARDLGISPSRLSDVLRGRYGISSTSADALAAVLGFNELERARFIDLVEIQHARSREVREAARKRAKLSLVQYQMVSMDTFKAIADWYHYAILELSQLENFESNGQWIAGRLGISVEASRAAVERLIRVGLMETDSHGKWRAVTEYTASPDGIPAEAIRLFHKQILEKAIEAIPRQSIEHRDLSSMVMTIDKTRMNEAKEFIRDFRREFDRKFGGSPEGIEVYCLAIQLLSLEAKPSMELTLPSNPVVHQGVMQ